MPTPALAQFGLILTHNEFGGNNYSNHDRGSNTHVVRFLERHGIPYHYLPTSKGNKREPEILNLVSGTDFLVLARYMQVIAVNRV
jgi:formyltetrahydrofolate deformylase